MSDAKGHTPGPWVATIDGRIVSDIRGECIARDVRAGNQPIVRAAPDMLAAGKDALAALDSLVVQFSGIKGITDALRAAIEKAEGK